MQPLTRSQIFDALRRRESETATESAKRLGATSRSVSTWLNHEVPDKAWLKILSAYSVDTASAEAIAREMPLLKKTPVQVEMERRNTAAAETNNSGRDPGSRKVGENRWWLDKRFFGHGSREEPMLTEGQKSYTPGHSLMLACTDALLKAGGKTSKHEIVLAYVENMRSRTPEKGDKVRDALTAQAEIYFAFLTEQGDIREYDAEWTACILADHVYESIVCLPVGDPREFYPVMNAKQGSVVEFMSFSNRYLVLLDLDNEVEEEVENIDDGEDLA